MLVCYSVLFVSYKIVIVLVCMGKHNLRVFNPRFHYASREKFNFTALDSVYLLTAKNTYLRKRNPQEFFIASSTLRSVYNTLA